MTSNESGIAVPLLHELLDMDSSTGTLKWKTRNAHHFNASERRTAEHIAANWNAHYSGKPALACADQFGHLMGRIFNKLIYAHRAIFAMTHGRWPEHEIDHINGDPEDNRPCNLRDVPHKDNLRNMKRSRANSSGATGVSFNKRLSKWMAHATVDGAYRHLGFHDKRSEAIAAREAANSELGFHTNHGSRS